jgi:hypothetical protein
MQVLRLRRSWFSFLLVLFGVFLFTYPGLLHAQTGTAGTISGVVKDPSGAAMANAAVGITDPVSGYQRTSNTGSAGDFNFPNVPFNPYHLTVSAPGFATYTQDVDVRSAVPVKLEVALQLGAASTSITVTENAADILEVEPTAHTDVDRDLFDKLPLESSSSSISSLITLASPGVVADSNGLFHGLGDHAENSFSIDGQAITDQQSKVFSNQIPEDAVQSMEVIQGAPPAEYGGKTSLVVKVTTRSGLGLTQPTGSVRASYGSFGSGNLGFDLGFGGAKWGNFISANGLQTSRFLDPPEFAVLHDKGNEENIFDRVDYKLTNADTLQLDLQYTHSWFQNPNSFDNLNLADPLSGLPIANTDQVSQIRTVNVAPTWTHVIGTTAVYTLGAFVRQDQFNYLPSANPFSDLGPLQTESVSQSRKLTNLGAHTDISYVKGINNLQAGVTYEQTSLTEGDDFGIVSPTLNSPCVDSVTGAPLPGFTNPSQCVGAGDQPNTASNPNANPLSLFRPDLLPFDLTRGATGGLPFHSHGDIKELALYAEDTITKGPWSFNLGLRGDFYNGLSTARQAEPRLGIAYKINPSNTVLRISYARSLESPFNENLLLSSVGCDNQAVSDLFLNATLVQCVAAPINPGYRNEFHAGLQQAFGKYFVLDGEYIWKYTHNAYDFSIYANTPIAFPIEWTRSKIPGFTVRGTVPNIHGLSAFVVLSHVSARFFLPQIGGLGIVPLAPSVFRIDHDENFEQTTHAQYQPWRRGPWFGFNWRYDSGLVAGATPCFAATATCSFSTPVVNGGSAAFIPGTTTPMPSGDVALVNAITGAPLTADQEFEGGFTCNGKLAAPTPFSAPLAVCPASQFGSVYLKIPLPGTENDDHNPQRVLPRSLFDASVGDDDILPFGKDRYKWSLRLTVINLTNKIASYNFLSTFSGTHYVTPRTETVELGFHF